MEYNKLLGKTEKLLEIKPGRYLAKVVKIKLKEELEKKASENEVDYACPTAIVTFEIKEGKYKGNKVLWRLKLDDDFTEKQQENSREMLNEFLENVDRDQLEDCLGLSCYVLLQKWSMNGKQGVFVAATEHSKPDISIEEDSAFLGGN